jgi:hypothetical protein
MRPDREEMLASIRRALVEYVAPEVTSVFARTQLTYALSLLAALSREGDGVVPVARENAELREIIRTASAKLGGSFVVNEALLREPPADAVTALELTELRAENERLLTLLVDVQAASEQAAKDDEGARTLAADIVAFLRRRSAG